MGTLSAAFIATAVLSLSPWLASEARAAATESDACGGVLFLSAPSCDVFTTETCTNECTPVASREVCAYRLTRECDSSCIATADVTCTAGCATACVSDCTAIAEPPNCMGLCMSDCQQDCNVTCSGANDTDHCRSSCAHNCSANCALRCDGEGSTECDPVCATACAGSCTARANVDCQVSCQESEFTTCETTVVEECRTSCETDGLGIFCDGQFCAADDLQACADDLNARWSISVDVTVDASGEVNGNGFSCAVMGNPAASVPGSRAPLAAIALAGLCALALARTRRPRR